jgi:putative tricarboxylic transport membrane protein
MIDAVLSGLFMIFQWPALGYLALGVFLGIWIGAVPGLGGILGLVVLLPFTYDMEPVAAFALLLGMFAVTSTSDTIASVMLGIPGTAASQATILDGYPLAQKGHAARAFGAAFSVSAFGGVFGALLLAVALPLILPVIELFAQPELFMLGILGLTMVGSLSGGSGSVLKGLTVALFGLLIAMVGYDETFGIPRYWFGTDYLLDGLPLIPVVLGLFAIPELLDLAVRDTSISRVPRDQSDGGGMMQGVRDAARNWWLVLRCSALGAYIGILPGLGAAIVDWFAYDHAVQTAKDKSQFGRGDIRGVIAPEAANNATRGGALIPMLAFGIPGSLGTAILLGALLIQGLKPGPDMLTKNLDFTFSMVWTLVIANILAAGLLMAWSNQVAKVAFIRGHLIVPGVILFVLMGAWLGGASIGDWVTCLGMGALGVVMKRGGWPRPPLILALILGRILETAFQISMRVHDGVGWLARPVVLIIMVLILASLFFSTRGLVRGRRSVSDVGAGEGSERNPMLSTPFGLGLLVLFVWAAIEALAWPTVVARLPLSISIPGAIIVAIVVLYDCRELGDAVREADGWKSAVRAAAKSAMLARSAVFFGYLLCLLAVAYLVGQMIALPLFIIVYLRRWGGYGWRISLGYAIVGWLILYGFYDQIMNVLWHQPVLFG